MKNKAPPSSGAHARLQAIKATLKPIESAMNLAYNRCQGKRLEEIDVSSTPSLPEPVAGTERVFHFFPHCNPETKMPSLSSPGFEGKASTCANCTTRLTFASGKRIAMNR